jgi:hypothetical protein
MFRNTVFAVTVKWLIFPLHVHEVPAWNVGSNTGCPDGISWLASVQLGKCRHNILRQATTVSFRIFLLHLLT